MGTKNGNPATATASTGKPKPLVQDSDCAELKDDVENADQKVQRSIRSGSRTKQSLKNKLDGHKGSTVSASKLKCPGRAPMKKPAYSAMSRLPARSRPAFAQGIKPGQASHLCKKDGKPFKHVPSNARSSCTHTEGRFIEDIFNPKKALGGDPGGCELIMKIKWRQRAPIMKGKQIIGFRSKPALSKPCPRCEKTICRAIFCGLKIALCKTENGKEVKRPPPDCKKHGY
jgi:hypothetical protein